MMRYIYSLIAVLGLLYAAPSSAFAKVNVFACEPEWGALATEMGGDLVKVYNATKAHQDIHHMRAKPSLLAAMRRADLVFCSGAALEVGWLPILMDKAARPNVKQDTVGWLMASDFVDKLEVRNWSVFNNKWKTATTTWEGQGASLKGSNVVVYHKSWSYLTDWLGINIIASLEPKPGLPPTTAHLESLLQSLKGKKVKAILVAPSENEDAAEWLSERTNIPVLHLPYTIGGSDDADTLADVFDETLSLLSKIP